MSLLLLLGEQQTGQSQYVRRFNPTAPFTSDWIKTAVGTVSTNGAMTWAALVRQENRGTQDASPIWLERSDTAYQSTLGINFSTGALNMIARGTTGTSQSSVVLPLSTWSIIAVTKGSGNVIPRFHHMNLATGVWTHGNGSIPVGAPTNPVTNLNLGVNFSGYMGVAGMWNAAMTDGEVEALGTNKATVDWYSHAVAPAALWQLDQTAITTSLIDRTSNGADEVSKSGTEAAFFQIDWTFGLTTTSVLLPSPTLLPSPGLLPGSLLDISAGGIDSAEAFGAAPFVTKSEDYPAAVIADGPSAYWRMSGAGSTMVATIGPNGTYENTPAEVPALIYESTDTARSFVSGSSQRAVVADNTATDLGDTFTLELFLSLPSLATSGSILYQDGNGPGIRYDSVNSRFTLAQAGVDKYQLDYIPTANRALHVVFTKSGSTVRGYVNGVEYTINVLSATTFTNGTSFYLASNNTSSYTTVTLDEVALYKTALSPASVANHYVAGGSAQILVPGIPSAEAFGVALLPRTVTITGIPSEEAFGNLAIVGPDTLSFDSIPSAEAFGASLTVGYFVVPDNELLRRLTVSFDEPKYTLEIDEPGGNVLVVEFDSNP